MLRPLSLDTGPEFSLESTFSDHMFGHPGISALEFAGAHEELMGKKTLSLKGKKTFEPQNEDRVAVQTEDTAEFEEIQPVVQDMSSQQRRRGTFINHTPRGFEVRSPKRTEFYKDDEQMTSRPHTSSWTQQWQQTPPKDWTLEDCDDVVNKNGPVELDSKEVDIVSAEKSSVRPQTTTQAPVTNFVASRVVTSSPPPSSPIVRNSLETNTTSPSGRPRHIVKRRRRQTPFKLPTQKATIVGRYSPLEPWVAKHRRNATSSSTEESPPKVDIDDVAEVSTFRALQEYFDSQTSNHLSEPAERQLSPCLSEVPPLISPVHGSISSNEPTVVFPIEDLGVPEDDTPGLPHRSPKSLDDPHMHTVSTFSFDTEFASAAQGQYSPYDDEHDVLVVPKRRLPISVVVGRAARAGSSTLGRMAPPILGHDALTATADLNDLSYYLKNTGPSPEPQDRRRNNSGFKIFKVGGKKSLAARVGSVEGAPNRPRQQRSVTPACAREMTTSRGVKHLKIVIPSDNLVQDQTITLPISGPGLSNRRSRHVSITWTEEMLNPLASSAVENVISGFGDTDEGASAPTTPLRSLKHSPIARKPVPVHDHPLATREDQTRARKLRDLKRINKSIDSTRGEDTTAGASSTQTLVHSLVPIADSSTEIVQEDTKQSNDNSTYEITLLEERVISLTRQNNELAEVLAKIVGLEAEGGDIDSDAVLRACKHIKNRSGDSG